MKAARYSLAVSALTLMLVASAACDVSVSDLPLIWITDRFEAYQVELSPTVGAAFQGHLLIPRDAERRMPAVICLPKPGRSPAEASGAGMTKDTTHREFGRRLAEQGYVVFAYSPRPDAGSGSKESDELGLQATQLRHIIGFFGGLECVDKGRIGYYACGRGEKTAEILRPMMGDLNAAVLAVDACDPEPRVLLSADAPIRDASDVQGFSPFDILHRCLRPTAPVGRDYIYTPGPIGRRIKGMPFEGGNPFHEHVLDSRAETRLRGRFWIPRGAAEFHGMAIKVSRDGDPGPLHVRFGSKAGSDDFGTAVLTSDEVIPLFDTWYEATVTQPKPVRGGETVHYEITADNGRLPEDGYVVYGPAPFDRKPVSGEDFPLAYRVLTDRPRDRLKRPNKEYAYQFTRAMTGPYYDNDPAKRFSGGSASDKQIALDVSWSIHFEPKEDDEAVLATAADDLKRFLKIRAGIDVHVAGEPAGAEARVIELNVSEDESFVGKVDTEEGYRVEVMPERIRIAARTPRGVMRGVYWLEDTMRFNGGPFLDRGATGRNCMYRRRITCTVCPSDVKYIETSFPLPYTDGLLARISHQGFNAVWLIVQHGEVVVDSKVFPGLNNPQAERRIQRIRDLVSRGKRFGIDVILYYGNEFCSVPKTFYEKRPDTKGVGPCYVGGKALCSSHPEVKEFVAETTRELFRRVPGLGGLCEIYDSEVYKHCACAGQQKACPRCKDFAAEDIAVDALAVIDRAMREVDPDADHIAWTYLGHFKPWAAKAIPKFPKKMIFQANFARHVPIVRGGVTNRAEDYIICEVGPSDYFTAMMKTAKAAGRRRAAKTEHATALSFVTVPYYPCMQQWCARAEKLSEFSLDTLWATYCHYGYTPGRTADVLKGYSWTDGPRGDELLRLIARRDFGPGTEDHVLAAWEHFTRGMRHFPYSNGVNKYPGPLQTGPSQPLFLDPEEKAMGTARAWQNDLKWCRPWGPKLTAECFGKMVEEFDQGLECLRKARKVATDCGKFELDREIGVAETMKRSAVSMINMIRWIPLRDAYAAASAGTEKEAIRKRLIAVGRDELANAKAALAYVEADSRLGAASNGNGSPGRGGLFTAALISKKIGFLEDTLQRRLAAETTSSGNRIGPTRSAAVGTIAR